MIKYIEGDVDWKVSLLRSPDRNLMGNVSSLFLLFKLGCILDTNVVGL